MQFKDRDDKYWRSDTPLRHSLKGQHEPKMKKMHGTDVTWREYTWRHNNVEWILKLQYDRFEEGRIYAVNSPPMDCVWIQGRWVMDVGQRQSTKGIMKTTGAWISAIGEMTYLSFWEGTFSLSCGCNGFHRSKQGDFAPPWNCIL